MKEIEKIVVEIMKEKRKEKNLKNNNLSRKERAHKLIVLGTLFTLLEIEDEDQDLLIGLLINYYSLTEEDKKLLKQKGKIFKIERNKLLEEEKENEK